MYAHVQKGKIRRFILGDYSCAEFVKNCKEYQSKMCSNIFLPHIPKNLLVKFSCLGVILVKISLLANLVVSFILLRRNEKNRRI